MTNPEALKELFVALGGEETAVAEANTNVEMLNAISEQLGGETGAITNPEAISNIAKVATGGGGGETTTVIIENNIDRTLNVRSLEGDVAIPTNTSKEITIPKVDASSIDLTKPPILIGLYDKTSATTAPTYRYIGTNCNASTFGTKSSGAGYQIAIRITITSSQAQAGVARIAVSIA